jgi:hypothetical protein
MVVAAILSCGAPYSFADTVGNAEISAAPMIVLSESQTDFTVPVSIDYAKAFAGVEIAVQCGDGVTIESVTYSKDISHAGPTEARGLVWFTTFSGKNDYTEELTAVIHASYSGRSNTSVVLDHAAFHTVEGNTFRTENVPLRETVTISRQGAENTPQTLPPPTTNDLSGATVSPGSGNPPSGDAVDKDSASKGSTKKDSTKKSATKSGDKAASGTTKTTKTTNTSNTTNTNKGATGVPSTSGTDGLAPVIANVPPVGVGGTSNEQSTSGDVGSDTVPISSSEVPLAGGNATTTTPNGANALGMATLIMALSCLAGMAFLGFLFIKRKRDKKKLDELNALYEVKEWNELKEGKQRS